MHLLHGILGEAQCRAELEIGVLPGEGRGQHGRGWLKLKRLIGALNAGACVVTKMFKGSIYGFKKKASELREQSIHS